MNRTDFILILPVVVLIGSLPVSVPAENELNPFLKGAETARKLQEKKLEQNRANATLLMQLAREIRQQRADAQAEVLFWFRTHPTERVFPQEEVERMLKSGGYYPAAVEGLTGSRNPFFADPPRSE